MRRDFGGQGAGNPSAAAVQFSIVADLTPVPVLPVIGAIALALLLLVGGARPADGELTRGRGRGDANVARRGGRIRPQPAREGCGKRGQQVLRWLERRVAGTPSAPPIMTLRKLTRDAATSEGRTARRSLAGPQQPSAAAEGCCEDGGEVCGHDGRARQRSNPDAAGPSLGTQPGTRSAVPAASPGLGLDLGGRPGATEQVVTITGPKRSGRITHLLTTCLESWPPSLLLARVGYERRRGREDWPGRSPEPDPALPCREPNGTLWFGVDLAPDGNQVCLCALLVQLTVE